MPRGADGRSWLAWGLVLVVVVVSAGARGRLVSRDDPPDEKPTAGTDVEAGLKARVDLPELVEAHNAMRREQGLPALSSAPKLKEAARIHALDMARNNKMAHEGSDGSTPGERLERVGYPLQKSGENVAMGYRHLDQVMDGWMNSPGHRENILGDFTEIGAAVVETADGGFFWAVEFGTPWPALEPAEASKNLLEAINQFRKESEGPALSAEARLQKVAQAEAELLAERDDLSMKEGEESGIFDQIKKAGYRFRRVGIAQASGQPAAADVMETWLEHKEYRDQLLGPFTQAGIGYSRNAGGKPYWTLILAQPLR